MPVALDDDRRRTLFAFMHAHREQRARARDASIGARLINVSPTTKVICDAMRSLPRLPTSDSVRAMTQVTRW